VILGITSLFGPIPIGGQIPWFDVWVMLAATIVLIPVLVSGWSISRREATGFLVLYAAYIVAAYLGLPEIVMRAFGGA
jgi:cation:H+ antiporter